MTSDHSIHALMIGMSENWWRAGIMPCVRSDLERDKPVAIRQDRRWWFSTQQAVRR